MEPTDKLSGGHCSRSGDYYGCPAAGTFDQQEQKEDLMSSSLFLPSESQSCLMSSLFLPFESQWPRLPSQCLSLPPTEEFSAPQNMGRGQIRPLLGCIPFGDGGQISALDEVPIIPAAVVEETNYAVAPEPLVATHGAGPAGAGQLSYNFALSSTTFDEFDDLLCLPEEEVQQVMMSLQPLLHPPLAPDGLPNTTNGGPAARSHADAVPPVAQQGTSTTADGLPHPQQQLPLPTIDPDPEAQPGGGYLSLVDEEVQIQQMAPTILPSQPPSSTPVINPGPDEANHAASAPMGSQGTLMPAAPQDQEAHILSRASTRRRAKSRGLPSRLQDGPGNLFRMGIDMIQQFARHIGKMLIEEKDRSKVWQHFWRTSPCKYCYTVTVICQYCNTVMRDPSTIEMLRHLKSCECYNNIHLLPASSGASKETQRSSRALQIKEIAENPNGENEPIETDNRNCATAARVDTQGTNSVVLSPRQQHQLLMDREEQIATILSSQPCCQQSFRSSRPFSGSIKYLPLFKPDSWCDLIIRLSDSSYCSSTTKNTHNGFRLKFSNNNKVTGRKIVHVHSSAAWVHVSENPYKDHAGVWLRTGSDTIGSSYLSVRVNNYDWKFARALGCAYPWQCMHLVLRSLGFRKEFATDFVIYALALVNGCYSRLWSPSSSNKGKSIVEQAGDVSSGKRKRKPAPPRSKVWNHFTKEEVETEGSKVTMARCKHCGSKLRADSASHGTTQLKRHITGKHPDELAKSPL